MNIAASIQARMNSSRLPGKVLKKAHGKPLILWQIERLRQSKKINDIIVATTTNSSDDVIADFCLKNGISVYRGSESDVLGRIAGLIKKFNIDIHVEFFGDYPLIDTIIIDEYIDYFLKKDSLDFLANSIKTTYPPGAEVIIYRGQTLLKAERLVEKNDPLREHVSIHIYKKPKLFKCENITAPDDLFYPDLYLEVDTEQDFEVINSIICHFSSLNKQYFSIREIIEFLLSNPKIASKNQNIKRRWKEFRE